MDERFPVLPRHPAGPAKAEMGPGIDGVETHGGSRNVERLPRLEAVAEHTRMHNVPDVADLREDDVARCEFRRLPDDLAGDLRSPFVTFRAEAREHRMSPEPLVIDFKRDVGIAGK